MLGEATAYVHRFSGALVTARPITARARWPVYGATAEKHPLSGVMQQPTEWVERGDQEVTAGTPGLQYGDNKEQRFIVPKWAFPLCYIARAEAPVPTEAHTP